MKRFLLSILVIFITFLPFACDAKSGEVIESIKSLIEVNEDASLMVTERFDFIALGENIKRGLVLGVPVVYQRGDVKRRVRFELISITLDDSPAEYSKDTADGRITFRVGNPNSELSHGKHSITLKYRIYDMVGFFEKHDELYWNAVSTNWQFPVLHAAIDVKLPGYEWGGGFNSIEWYVGQGGTKGNTTGAELLGSSVETVAPLSPGEGLTVVYTWDKGIIQLPVKNFIGQYGWVFFLLIALLTGVYYLFVWSKHGRDLPLGTIIPIFYPPKTGNNEISPGMLRYVIQKDIDENVFSANLIDLAVKGYLKLSPQSIERTPKIPDNSLAEDELRILEQLGDAEVQIQGGKSGMLQGMRSAADLSIESFGKAMFTRNSGYWLCGFLISLLFPIFTFICGYWDYIEWPFQFGMPVSILLSSSFAISFFRKKRGVVLNALLYFSAAVLILLINLAVAAVCYLDVGEMEFAAAFLSSVVCSALIAVFWYLMPNYSDEGTKIVAAAEGLKLYINTAEKSRLEAFNPPEETPEMFERLLPLAFSLGIAKTWANKFAKILESSNYAPTWYAGDYGYLLYGGGMNSFASNVSSSSLPPQSDPTFSSGSGGGGSVGGGGGGTSGAGW